MRTRIESFLPSNLAGAALPALQLDAAVQGFSQGATNTASIAAMMAGSFAYQAGKLASLQALAATPLRAVSPFLASIFGLGAEVSAYQATEHIFHPSVENFAQAWRRSFGDFAAMKSVGHLLCSSNIFLQHFSQDMAMVFSHYSSAWLGLSPNPEGSFAQQILEAETMNLQLGAGQFLARHWLGHRLQRVEQGMAYRSHLNLLGGAAPEVLLRSMASRKRVPTDLAEINKGFRNSLGGIEQKLQHLDGEGVGSASHNEHFAKLFTSFFELLDDATPGIEGIQNPALRRRLFECFHRFAGHEVSDPKLWVGNLTYALLTTYTHLQHFAGEEACREVIQFVSDHWQTPRLRLKVLKELQENRRFLNSRAREFLQEKITEAEVAFTAAEAERRNSTPPPGAPLITITGLSSLLYGFDAPYGGVSFIWYGLAFALIGGGAWMLRQSLQARRAREEFSAWVEANLAAMHAETDLPEVMVGFEPQYRLLHVASLAPDPLAAVFRDAKRELSRAHGATLSEATRNSLVLIFMDKHPDSGESIAFIRESHALRFGDVALLEYTRAFDRYLLAYVLVDFIDALLVHRDIRLSPEANDRVWQWTNDCYLQQMKDAEFLRARMTVPSTPEPEPPPSQKRAATPSTSSPNAGTISPTTRLLELAHVDIKNRGALKGLADFLAALHENPNLRADSDLPRAIKELTASARIGIELHPGISDEARESLDRGLTRLLKVNGYSATGEALRITH